LIEGKIGDGGNVTLRTKKQSARPPRK